MDSENIVTQLRANEILADHYIEEDQAEVVIVNTCGFIESAKQESIDTILQYAALKEEGVIEKLYVTGCLSQRYKTELAASISEVDAFFGTLELPALLHHFNADYKHELIGERSIFTPEHYAYLKISEGCNRTCTFCAIPLMRGAHRSRPMDVLVDEARKLVGMGVKEIILIAQELTYYGLDIYRERKLHELLRRLVQIEGLMWIRLHYAYPSRFPRETLEVMASHANICSYLDIPLQHADDNVLKMMRRQINQKETLDLIAFARKTVPNLTLRTTMLVGFPGETESAFIELCNFVKRVRFDRLGVFEYSHEEGTAAYGYDDNVPPAEKERRAGVLMEIQKGISKELNERKVGSVVNVLIDRVDKGIYYGRTEADSPEVDNEVIIETQKYLRVGDFAMIKICDATEYDLYGIPI